MNNTTSLIGKRILPLLDRVVVRKPKAVEKTASGILIPEKSQESIVHGEVIAVGPGDKDHKMTLITGDKVILPTFGGAQVKLGDETVFIYRESEIPGKLVDQ